MSQSGFIAALLLAAFILYLAAQNRLTTYAAVLWGPTAAPPPQPASTGGKSPGGIALPGAGLTGIGEGAGGGSSGLLSTAGDIAGLLEFLP